MDPYALMTPLLGFAVITAALPLAFAWLWHQQREPAAMWWAAACIIELEFLEGRKRLDVPFGSLIQY